MNSQFRFILFFIIMLFLVAIFQLLKKKKINIKYTLLWLGSLFILIILVIFPKISLWLCKITGIKTVTSLIFSLSLLFLLVIIFSLTVIVSKMKDQINILVQFSARLEKRIRELEKEKKDEKI